MCLLPHCTVSRLPPWLCLFLEASSDTPGQSAPREIPYFGSPVLGQTHFSTIKRNHSNGSKQPKSPKPAFNPSLNLSTNYSSPLFQSSRTNVTSCLDDDVFCSKGASPSLTSSSSSVTSAFSKFSWWRWWWWWWLQWWWWWRRRWWLWCFRWYWYWWRSFGIDGGEDDNDRQQ